MASDPTGTTKWIRWCETHADWAADHLSDVPEDRSRCRWSRFVNSDKPCQIKNVLHVDWNPSPALREEVG